MSQLVQNVLQRIRRKKTGGLQPSTEEFLRSLNLIVGLDQLLEVFSAKLKEMFDAQAIYVVLFEPISNRYVGKKAKGGSSHFLDEFNFSRSDNLMKWLNVNQSVLEVAKQPEIVRFLSSQEQNLLAKTDTVLVVPFIVVNRLTGAIFVGRKMTGDDYTPSEVHALTILANQSALAIEHAIMYQFQEERLKKLFHSDKLATVGELAAGAAHEIRNPLTSIRSTVQYLQSTLPEEKKLSSMESLKRWTGLIRSSRDCSPSVGLPNSISAL